jgi:hypothetical protein
MPNRTKIPARRDNSLADALEERIVVSLGTAIGLLWAEGSSYKFSLPEGIGGLV